MVEWANRFSTNSRCSINAAWVSEWTNILKYNNSLEPKPERTQLEQWWGEMDDEAGHAVTITEIPLVPAISRGFPTTAASADFLGCNMSDTGSWGCLGGWRWASRPSFYPFSQGAASPGPHLELAFLSHPRKRGTSISEHIRNNFCIFSVPGAEMLARWILSPIPWLFLPRKPQQLTSPSLWIILQHVCRCVN